MRLEVEAKRRLTAPSSSKKSEFITDLTEAMTTYGQGYDLWSRQIRNKEAHTDKWKADLANFYAPHFGIGVKELSGVIARERNGGYRGTLTSKGKKGTKGTRARERSDQKTKLANSIGRLRIAEE